MSKAAAPVAARMKNSSCTRDKKKQSNVTHE